MNRITAQQVRLIHMARRQTDLNELQYRTLLRNVAGVDSSRELNQAAFEDVLAVFESCGFCDRMRGPMYWRQRAEQRGFVATTRQIYKISAMATASRYDIGSLCDKFSHGRTRDVGLLLPREAYELIEMFKAEEARESRTGLVKRRSPAPDPNRPLNVPALTNEEVPF